MAVEIPVVVNIDKAFADAAKRVGVAIEPLRKSVEGLTEDLETWTSIMSGADIKSDDWLIAAKNIQAISEKLAQADYQLRRYTSNEGSIKQMSIDLAELNRRWESMGASQKFEGPDGRTLSADAQKAVEQYKQITAELNKQGKTLQQIIAEENRLEQLRQKGIQSRRYENAILNTTVKTMRVLQEQERILSERLSRATIGSGKYKQLKADLEGVRAEIEKVNGKVSESTIPALDKADNRLATLVKRSIQLVALHSASTFIRNVREVTSEFEMQRVALGGIIQDTEKANALFKQIKAAAVESPFEIKDLVTYTKQLSAYRVETEDLFKVTMQLADVSAGLGVDMNRLILAYGQVKAASVLRGQELRQFTEAGIPLVKLLADKFEELGRVGTTTADVFELISKRAVPFEMIAEIFDDMTQRGGVFYKMQEKQAETLLGQWNNLKDALSIMYDEIGNTDVVHGAMTTLISDARFIFQNWRLISGAVKAAAIQFAALKVASLWLPNLKRELALAQKAQDAFTRSQELSRYAAETGSKSALLAASRLKTYSTLMKRASLETRLFHRTWLQLRAVMSGGGWIGLAIGAVTALTSVIYSAWQESRRLDKELSKIGAEGDTSINRSISNFSRLAAAAVNAADGSKEQVEAIAELKRTYGDIIPVQQLEASALRELEGNYTNLTRAIREKISEQIREQKVNTILDEFGKKVSKRQRSVKDYLSAYGLDKEQIGAVMDAIQQAVDDGMVGIESSLYDRRALFQNIIKDLTGVVVDFDNGFRDLTGTWRNVRDMGKAEGALNSLLDVFLNMDKAVNSVNDSMKDDIGTYGKFAQMSRDLKKDLERIQIDTSSFGKRGTFSYNQEDIRQRVSKYWDYIQKAFDEVNRERSEKIDIADALLGDGKINFDFLSNAVDKATEGGQNTHLDAFIDSIQEGYERLVPSDRIVNLVRAKVKEFATAFDVPMNTAQQYYKKAEDSMEDYVKSLQESEKALKSSVNAMKLNNEEVARGGGVLRAYSESEVEATDNALSLVQALIKFFEDFKKNNKTTTPYTQDPFINQLQERMKFMKDFQKGYEDLQKYMSSAAAEEKESKIMLTRGLSLGIDPAEQKRAAQDLSKWYEDTYNAAFDYLKKSKGVTGTMQEFLSKQITGNTNRDKMLKDFQSLIQSLFDAKTDFDTSQTTKNIEESLKRVTDEIKRSETARNFYQDILGLTGDEDLATTMTVSVYGDVGEDFKDRIKKQLVDSLNSLDAQSFAGLDDAVRNAFDEGDYEFLVKNLDKVPEKLRDVVKQVASDAEKYNADLFKNFANLVSKYGSSAQKIATIRAKAENEINKIKEALVLSLKDTGLTDWQINDFLSDSFDEDFFAALPDSVRKSVEETREIIKSLRGQMDLDVFKESDDYIKFFAEINVMTIEQASTVRGKLRQAYLKAFHDGSITADELRKNLRAIDNQFKKLSESTSIFGAYLSGGFEKANEKLQEYSNNISVLAEKMKSGKELDQGEQAYASRMLQMFGSGETANIKSYGDLISKFQDSGGLAKAGEAFGKMGEGMSTMASKGPGALAIVDAIIKAVNSTITGLQQIIDQINEVRSEDKKIGEWFRYISDFNQYAYSGWEKLKSGDVIGAATDTVSSLISIYNNIKKSFNKKYDEGIKEQSELIEELEYSYSRLNTTITKTFGQDYIHNYNKQMEILQAQADAYRKQAEDERAKGKSADEETAKGYEKSARDVENTMEDMRSQLSEFFAGTDVASAAKDFASAWIEAYKQFGSTTDAMSEKFNEMIENMVVNSLAAALIQDILDPVFRAISEASKDGELSAQDIGAISAMLPERMKLINDSMNTLMSEVTAAGTDLRQQAGQFTGISRNIAGASEESITGLAAGINTQNFYISHIDATVTAILSAMTGGSVVTNEGANGAVTNPYQTEMLQHASHIPTIDQNLSELLSEVRKVIKPRGTAATHYVATNL